MKRQTSLFNRAVFLTDIRRFWWVPALNTLAFILFGLLPMRYRAEYISAYTHPYHSASFASSFLLDSTVFLYALQILIAVVLSMLLFSYLHKKSTVATLHAQPVTRLTLYITHTVSGLLALTVPVLIGTLILLLMRTDAFFASLVPLSHIGAWACSILIYGVISFCFSTFIGMFVGNVIAQPIFTLIFALLPLFIEGVVMMFSDEFLHGYCTPHTAAALKLYLSPTAVSKVCGALFYIGASLVFSALGYVVYKLRNLENHGEVVAFPRLRPVFIFCVAFFGGILGYIYLQQFIETQSFFWMLPFGAIGLVIANMISKKAFTLKGSAKPAIAYAIAFLALYGTFHLDITGFETRVPDAKSVKSVTVSQDDLSVSYAFFTDNSGKSVEQKKYIPFLTSAEDIENVIRFHTYKTEQKGSNLIDYTDPYIYITYQLKNGTTLSRQYRTNYAKDAEVLKPVMDTEECKKRHFPILRDDMGKIVNIFIGEDKVPSSRYLYPASDAEQITRITESLKADLAAVPYEEYIDEYPTSAYIRITYRDQWVYQGTDDLVPESEFSDPDTESTYYIRPSYTNTIATLEEIGFHVIPPQAESYTSATVENTETGNTQTVTDAHTLRALFDYVTKTPPARYSNNYITITFASDTAAPYKVYRSELERDVPAELLPYFQ